MGSRPGDAPATPSHAPAPDVYWVLETVVSPPREETRLVFADAVPAAAFTEAVRARNPHLRLDVLLLHRVGAQWDDRDVAMLGEPPWVHWTDRYADLLEAVPRHEPGAPVPDTGCRMAWPAYFTWLGTLDAHPEPSPQAEDMP